MHAVVLVGGFGTRLRPLTTHTPKPMLPVVGEPIIARLIDRLAPAGVTDVVLALGFKPEPFRDAFPDGRHGEVRVHYAVEPEPLDTGGAIAFAARHVGVDATFLVANGDVMTDLDGAALVAAHRRLGTAATLHLTPVEDPSAFGVVETDSDGRVHRFVEKPAPGETDSNLINAGTYVFEPEVLDLIPAERRVSVEREVFPRLVADERMGAFATDDYWLDTGRPSEYLRASLDLLDGRRGAALDGVLDPTCVAGSARVSRTVVEVGAKVSEDATVTDSVLLPGASIESGAEVTRSIIAGTVGTGATVTDSVIGAGYTVPCGDVVRDERRPADA